jgi:nucleoid-associated protein EbfC
MIGEMDIQKMMQQMQSQMKKSQAELTAKTFDASVAGGKVSVTANGQGDITSLQIAKDIVDPEDVEILQGLILSAVQQVQKKVKDSQATEMGKLTSGLGLPPGMGF